METRVSYTLVGLFVLLLGAALVAGVIWLAADYTTYDHQTYSIYSHESVSGINRNAPVKYQGVDVGTVRDIRLDPDAPERVHILVDIRVGTPLREDTRARLTTQGLTGIGHVELSGGTAAAGPPSQPEGEPYPVITTSPSLMSRLDDALVQGVDTLGSIEARLDALLSEGNIDAISDILGNVDMLTAELLGSAEKLDRVLSGASNALDEGSALGQRLPGTLDRLDETLLSFQGMADNLGTAGEDMATATREGLGNLDELTRSTLPQLTELMREVEELAAGMGRLANELAENPNLLIFGRPERVPGPGER